MVEWLSDVDEDQTFLSVVTLAEVRYGVEACRKVFAGASSKHGCRATCFCALRTASFR